MTRFRLMTANLFTRFVDLDDLGKVLDKVSPDVLVTVEMTPEAARVIEGFYEHHLLLPDAGYLGRGIAARYPMEVQPEPAWRGLGGQVTVEGDPINVAVAHITDPIFGNWRENRRRRREQVDSLLSWSVSLPEEVPQLVAGDMNASPAWDVYKRMASHWKDLAAEAALSQGRRPASTWGPGRRVLRIDHVFGLGLRGFEQSVTRIKGSDHSAVVIDLEVSPD